MKEQDRNSAYVVSEILGHISQTYLNDIVNDLLAGLADKDFVKLACATALKYTFSK